MHKDDIPIRPVVNINSPTYELAKFLRKVLHKNINIPNTYITPNFISLAQNL